LTGPARGRRAGQTARAAGAGRAAHARGGVTVRVVFSRGPIDPLTGPMAALAGRVVTMDDAFTIKERAVVYIDQGRIVAVQERGQAPPGGFERVGVVETGATLFPGLIELHNHLSYNALPLWSPVPKRFVHRGQWPTHRDYRKLITGPMTVVGEHRDADGQPALLPALIRYVESKCLMAGVTTSQGIKLVSNSGVQRFYRGIVRNVEQTDDPDLPEAQARILDITAKDARSFLARLQKEDSCFLLHLSEGVTDPGQLESMARRHFLALEVAPDLWAISDRFTGIHAAGLLPEDFEILATHKGAIVWSPLSNLLLYGSTARVDAARTAGVPISLGADWSPTGSKNLLGELKVAWLYNQHFLDELFSAREIVAMATRAPAQMLKWGGMLGTIEAGKRADILAVDGDTGDGYDKLIRASESSLRLVMINGVARYGAPDLMGRLAPDGETVRVGGETRRLYLEQETSDPSVRAVALRTATTTLRRAFRDLKVLAREMEKPKPVPRRAPHALDAPPPPVWSLALDEIRDTGVEMRPRLPFRGPGDFTGPRLAPRPAAAAAGGPLSEILEPIRLDPLTVRDDDDYLDQIAAQPNVPEAIRQGLKELY
jgi:5-methylthioadenosine/S-adenosylhomocysteine deaminase